MSIRKLWNKYSVYAGILGLIADIITLWGYLGITFRWGSNTSPAFAIVSLPFDQHRLLFIVSAALIIFGFGVLLIYLPQQGHPYSTLVINPSQDIFEYAVGIRMLLFAFGTVAPVVWIWIRVFLGWPSDGSMFLVVFVALLSLSLLLLMSLTQGQFFENISKKPSWPLIPLAAVLTVSIVAYGFTNWELGYAILAVIVIVSGETIYLKLVKKSTSFTLYTITTRVDFFC